MKYIPFCLFLLAASSGIRAADNLLGDYIIRDDLEAFEKYLTFETFTENLNGRLWLTLIKPSGSLFSVYVPTIRYKKFPYCTAFALSNENDVLQMSFDYTSKPSDTGTMGLLIESCDSITHYKRLDYNTASVLIKLYADALQQEDESLECRKDLNAVFKSIEIR